MSLVDRIIETFQALKGDRSISEIENWMIIKYGARWTRSSFSTSMADMVPVSLGGPPSSGVDPKKRVLRRVRSGVYSFISAGSQPEKPRETKAYMPKVTSGVLSVFVKGKPTPFANPGEFKWKYEMRKQVLEAYNSNESRGLVMSFGYRGRGDLDNLCEPVFSIVVNEKKWFDGQRPNIEWWLASKSASRLGCRIATSSNDPPPFGLGEVIFEGEYTGPLPGRAVNVPMLDWVKNSYVGGPVEKWVSVELVFNGWDVNLCNIANGPVKSCIDCLQPILGGPEGNPDDWRIASLLVKRVKENVRNVTVRVYSN